MSAISSIASSSGSLATEVGLRVAVKAQDVARDQGDAVVAMLEAAAELQQNLDGAPAGGGPDHLGSLIDVTA